MMDDFVGRVNANWERTDPFLLCAFVLWRLNFVHPFINGNGRTARAIAYVVLCLKIGAELPGQTALPELLKRERGRYVEALRDADVSFRTGQLDLTALYVLVQELVAEQTKDSPQVAIN